MKFAVSEGYSAEDWKNAAAIWNKSFIELNAQKEEIEELLVILMTGSEK